MTDKSPASATFPATVTPKPGDTVRLRLDYMGEVDEVGDVGVPVDMWPGMYTHIRVARPDDLHDCWTVEVITPPMDEPTTLGTVVVDAEGNKAVRVGPGRYRWQIVGGVQVRWDDLTQPVRLATEEERG